jgi:hypothetical protein
MGRDEPLIFLNYKPFSVKNKEKPWPTQAKDRLYVVSFHGSSRDEMRRELKKEGAKVIVNRL